MNIHPFTCQRDGLVIRGMEYLPEGKQFRAVIISPVFMGTQKSYRKIARSFAKAGYAVYTFDFCGGSPASTSDGSTMDMSALTEVEDLLQVIEYVERKQYIHGISLMGFSQGGLVSALAAARVPDKIEILLLNYPGFSIPDDAKKGSMLGFQFDPADPPEYFKIFGMKLGKGYISDAGSLDVFNTILQYHGPVMLIHGTADRTINWGYSVHGWRCLTAGKVIGEAQKIQLGKKEDFPGLPNLPKGVLPRADRSLMLISGSDHNIMFMNLLYTVLAMKEFLGGYSEVLTVDVQLTDKQIRKTKDGREVKMNFTGKAVSPWFRGKILPGACDTQVQRGLRALSKCADYKIAGTDYAGEACEIHIINQGEGVGWKPTVKTDSKALDFLNTADCHAILQMRKCGPVVRIYAPRSSFTQG